MLYQSLKTNAIQVSTGLETGDTMVAQLELAPMEAKLTLVRVLFGERGGTMDEYVGGLTLALLVGRTGREVVQIGCRGGGKKGETTACKK